MRSIIYKSVVLSAPVEKLFEMYMDPDLHGTFTGAPVKIAEHRGSQFRAFDGKLEGTILQVIRPKLIVQSWRSFHFKDGDPDSMLILSFTAEGEGDHGRIDLVHLDVPDYEYDAVNQGWEFYYFVPWRAYLANR